MIQTDATVADQRNLRPRTCIVCRAKFRGHTSKHFCSEACKSAPGALEFTCPDCRQTFRTHPTTKRRYCADCSKRRQHAKKGTAEPGMTPAQVEAFLQRAVANETAMPWERAS